jgi:biopolymer transport protein TolR
MRRRVADEFEPSELNLVPYMDIMVNLLMFLLVATTVAGELRVVPTDPPGTDRGGKPVSVALFVGQDRVVVQEGADAAEFPPTAWGAVTDRLEAIHGRQGDSIVAIAADPAVPYNAVMAAIDAARETRDGKELYPRFSLGAAVRP